MGKPHVVNMPLVVQGFAGQESTMMGKCRIHVYLVGFNCVHEFFIFPEGAMETQMILGQPWQRTYQCTLKWHKNAAKVVIKNKKLLIPFIQQEIDSTESTEAPKKDSQGLDTTSASLSPIKPAETTTNHQEGQDK